MVLPKLPSFQNWVEIKPIFLNIFLLDFPDKHEVKYLQNKAEIIPIKNTFSILKDLNLDSKKGKEKQIYFINFDYLFNQIVLEIENNNSLLVLENMILKLKKISKFAKIIIIFDQWKPFWYLTLSKEISCSIISSNELNNWFVNCIFQTINSGIFISPNIQNLIKDINSKLNDITHKEISILSYLSMGFTDKEIADLMFNSPLTINTHRRNIVQKLSAKNTTNAVRIAFEVGIL